MWSKIGLLAGTVGAAAFATSHVARAESETTAALYEKAKAEGGLSIYGGGPIRQYEPWAKEFEQRFPGIQVKITGGYSGGLAPMIDKQIAGKKLEVDFVTFQAVQEFSRWKSENVLMPVKTDAFDILDERFRDPDGAFTPVTVLAIAPAYNTKLLAAGEAPRSPPDFLKPEFKGKLITPYPHDDDATLFAFYTIIKKYGWSWMDTYMANNPKFIQGHLGTIRSVAAGESVATLDMMVHHTLLEKSEGHPVDVAFSDTDAMPTWGQRGAIFKDAPHPNAAKLYLTWFMQKEQQSRTGTWSARKDLAPPFGLKPIFEYNIANDYADIVTNPGLLDDLRKRFVGYTGDITNKGGIR